MNDVRAFEFESLTGHKPFPWQRRLFDRFIGELDDAEQFPACSLPTGLGKTSVMAVWLLALAASADEAALRGRVPRRLAYVVNRRTIVDQATREAEKFARLLSAMDDKARLDVLQELRAKPEKETPEEHAAKLRQHAAALGELRASLLALAGLNTDHDLPLAISTLRGQFADNGEWAADPARPAIIVGTVDMIGSRLLFSGYGRGFKSRPLHAGFLGQDTLLVHDEAHLEPAFQKLIERIYCEQRGGRMSAYGQCDLSGNPRARDFRPLHVMPLTATPRTEGETFELSDEERNPPENIPDPPTKPIHFIWQRLSAKKTIHLHPLEDKKGKDGDDGSNDQAPPSKEDAKKKKKKVSPSQKIVELARQRAEEYEKPGSAILVFLREVVDVLEVAAALEKAYGACQVKALTGTMRGKERDEFVKTPVFQRFLPPSNRDNAIAPAEGTVFLVCTSAGEVGVDISADHLVCDLTTFDSMAQRFGRVNRYGDGAAIIDVVHPTDDGFKKGDAYDDRRKVTLALLKRLDGDGSPKAIGNLPLPERIAAFSPTPTILDATDILFDAWALTSIPEKMPGRPEVAPYLHGIADDLPQATVAWRTELDLLKDHIRPQAALKAIFSKHPIRPHESLTARSYQLVKFLKEITAPKVRPDLLDTRVVLIFSRGLRLTTVKDLIDNPGPLNADPTLVLPASFGGLDGKGMLAALKPDGKKKSDQGGDDADNPDESGAPPPPSLDIADEKGYEREPGCKSRRRILIDRTDHGWTARAVPGAPALPDDWNLDEPRDTSTPLVRRLQEKSGLKVRLVQPLKWNEEGEPICSLICLSPLPKQSKATEQLLDAHVCLVEQEARRLADALLQDDPVFHTALLFAAKWHDEGKKSPRWQRYIGRKDESDPALGKSADWRDPKLLAGYRHEFGSLLRIREETARSFFADTQFGLDAERQPYAYDLALHLIAAHHGAARPHFSGVMDDEFTTPRCEEQHTLVIQRFARLQRRYGRWGLAYLESLLRAADIAASRTVGVDPEVDDDEAEEAGGGEA